jgi:hypothetical protein
VTGETRFLFGSLVAAAGRRSADRMVRRCRRSLDFGLGDSEAPVIGSFGRKVNVQEAKLHIFFAVSSIHGPQGSTLAATKAWISLWVAISLLNGRWLRELRSTETPRACVGRKFDHGMMLQMRWNFRTIQGRRS